MALRDWAVALQAPLFVAVVVPALVGAAVAWRSGAVVPLPLLLLVLAALVLIQAGANLLKGLVESVDRRGPPRRGASPFVFDSGAVERLAWSRPRLQWLTRLLFALGAVAGVVVVLLYGDLVLLALGVAGGLLGFFYSAPPLKLSYRGIGEIPTFLAFGPLLVLGVAYVFAGALLPAALWAGIIMGFLATVISFARYFPLAKEDRAKGKRTPVVAWGPRRGAWLLGLLLVGPYLTAAGGGLLADATLLPFLATLPLAAAVVLAQRWEARETAGGGATGLAVLLHAVGGAVLAVAYML